MNVCGVVSGKGVARGPRHECGSACRVLKPFNIPKTYANDYVSYVFKNATPVFLGAHRSAGTTCPMLCKNNAAAQPTSELAQLFAPEPRRSFLRADDRHFSFDRSSSVLVLCSPASFTPSTATYK